MRILAVGVDITLTRLDCSVDSFAVTYVGRAVAQAVSRWLPANAARIRVRTRCRVCGGQSGTGGRFSPSTSVSPANHLSTNFSNIKSPGAGTIGLLVATVRSGPNWNPPPQYSN
jgi:hypothetical protein